MGASVALMYFYYSIVYSTIASVTEPASRGSAMAIYFMAMYLLGASFGPYVVGGGQRLFHAPRRRRFGNSRIHAQNTRTVPRRRTAFGNVSRADFEYNFNDGFIPMASRTVKSGCRENSKIG